mmetsp:Transcript_82967/g.221687  ORF Transcript_82967/g.221687 Transcript_82967/m.221687 type:complete len:215 (-) Transcript_82967:616-1260(-)
MPKASSSALPQITIMAVLPRSSLSDGSLTHVMASNWVSNGTSSRRLSAVSTAATSRCSQDRPLPGFTTTDCTRSIHLGDTFGLRQADWSALEESSRSDSSDLPQFPSSDRRVSADMLISRGDRLSFDFCLPPLLLVPKDRNPAAQFPGVDGRRATPLEAESASPNTGGATLRQSHSRSNMRISLVVATCPLHTCRGVLPSIVLLKTSAAASNIS